jgi:hypothetical protein
MRQASVSGLAAYGIGTYYIDWALNHAKVAPYAASDAVREKLGSMDWTLFQTQTLADPALLERTEQAAWQSMRERVGKILAQILDQHVLRVDAQ